jgi:FkbM family methyltransferase
MDVLRRLRAFGRYARQLAALGPTAPDRARIALVACWLLARQYVPRLPAPALRIRVRRHGRTLTVTLRSYGDLDVVHELFVREEYGAAVLPATARVVVDAGANIGLATMELRLRFPEARIIACEPDPKAYATLVRNVGGDPGVEAHNVALSDADGETTLWTSPTSVVSSFERTLGGQRPVTVPTLTLASLLARTGVDRVDLLKLDVEGAERLVLSDGAPLERVDALVGEVHPSLIGQDAESFCRARLPGFDVTLAARPGLEDRDERLFWATRRR